MTILPVFLETFSRASVQNEELQTNQECLSNFVYHDEYKIIRELLWILIANDKRVTKRIELLRTQTSVPSLIRVMNYIFSMP